jgi:hypothetical protein
VPRVGANDPGRGPFGSGVDALSRRRSLTGLRLGITVKAQTTSTSDASRASSTAEWRSHCDKAQASFVSPNTVPTPVVSILGKTGSAHRTEATAFAMRPLPVAD